MIGESQVRLVGNFMRHFGNAFRLAVEEVQCAVPEHNLHTVPGSISAAFSVTGAIEGDVLAYYEKTPSALHKICKGSGNRDLSKKTLEAFERDWEEFSNTEIKLAPNEDYTDELFAYNIHKTGGAMTIRIRMHAYVLELYARRIHQISDVE